MNIFFNKINNFVSNWFAQSNFIDSKRLSFYRIVFMLYLILFLEIPQYYSKMVLFPVSVFNPPPIFSMFFNQVLPLIYFEVTDKILIITALFILLGLFTKISGIFFSLIIIVNNGFIFSLGKIDHSFLVWFSVFLLSFSSWNEYLSLDSIIKKM